MFSFATPVLPLSMFERFILAYTCNSFMITVVFHCMKIPQFIYPLSFDGCLDCLQFLLWEIKLQSKKS